MTGVDCREAIASENNAIFRRKKKNILSHIFSSLVTSMLTLQCNFQIQGSKTQAQDGTLVVLVAGDRSLFDDCQSCFQVRIIYFQILRGMESQPSS